jgi:hypothetical protein
MVLSPTASAASMSARCEIDLSPGVERLPARPSLGCAVKDAMAENRSPRGLSERIAERVADPRCCPL